MKAKITVFTIALLIVAGGYVFYAMTNNSAKPLVFWQQSDENNNQTINHDAWDDLLDNYVETEHDTGVFLFDYSGLDGEEIAALEEYINYLSSINPRFYSRIEQKAYWINLYNALTVKLIIDNYPLESITTLGKTVAAFGPWDDQIINIVGRSLSLNDIEHRILRAFWKDPRIHFAVNCASYGCPNLQNKAFTAENIEELMSEAAYQYMSHPRGSHFDGDVLVLSSIFDWYAQDFGSNIGEVLATLSEYLPENSARQLRDYQGSIQYEYDWSLNDLELYE